MRRRSLARLPAAAGPRAPHEVHGAAGRQVAGRAGAGAPAGAWPALRRPALRVWVNGQLEHDGNPMMTWMMGNVVVQRNYKDEVFPRKAGGKDSPNKIDGPVAALMALGRAMINATAPVPALYVL